MPLGQESGVNTTFRINTEYVETTPYKDNPEDIGITSVTFLIRRVGEPSITQASGSKVGKFWEGSRNLTPNTSYEVRTRIVNPQGTELSGWQQFDTDDLTTYDNVEVKVMKHIEETGQDVPLAGAKIIITNPNGSDWESRETTEKGLAWYQRVPRGTYSYTISRTGYDPVSGTVNTASNGGNMGVVVLTEL